MQIAKICQFKKGIERKHWFLAIHCEHNLFTCFGFVQEKNSTALKLVILKHQKET